MNTNLEQAALDYSNRQSMINEFKRIRDNDPSPLMLAQKRIQELEALRDETYAEVNGWIEDFREYFPGATGLHDVFRGIEALEAQRNKLVAELAALAVAK